jgi:HEAT repeat protein
MLRRQISLVLFATLILAIVVAPVQAEDAPPITLSLELYQKIKADFDQLYGSNATLVSGLQARSKAEVEAELRADAAANKDALIRALQAASPLQREMAALALEYCGDRKAAVEALTPLLLGDNDKEVRRAAAAVLARIPDAAAAGALIKALADPEDAVRGVSATALGNIKDSRAVEPLLKIVKEDSKPMVRLQSAMALSRINHPAAVTGLKAALDRDSDERVKMAIAGALRSAMGHDDSNTRPIPSAVEASNELAQLAHEMKDIEGKLRQDRYDASVQSQGKGIEDKLSALILKLDAG